MVTKPFQYKMVVKKKTIHIAHCIAFILFSTEVILVFIFFRQDTFMLQKNCTAVYILHRIAFLEIPLLNFIILFIILLLNYLIITIKLKQRQRHYATSMQTNDIKSKFSWTYWFVLSAFMVTYLPVITLFAWTVFIEPPYSVRILIFQDFVVLFYFMNNVVNPLIDYKTFVTFREGYKSLLTCKGFNGEQNKQTVMNVANVGSDCGH